VAGNILLKGYTQSLTSVLTTEINSLADGNTTALGTAQDNTSNLDDTADFQLDLASLTISSTTAYCTVFIVPSVDGTNYPDWGSSAFANYDNQYVVGIILLKNVSAATARGMLTGIPIGPYKYKVALRNDTGATLASSGSTLGIRTYARSYT